MTIESLAESLDDVQRRAFEAVRELAQGNGLPVYLVGGPVRDALLGAPVQDLDFVVEGDAVAFARELSERLALRQAQDVREAQDVRVIAHARFGTATVALGQAHSGQDSGRIDLVTARRESYRRPGQLPDVTPGNIADDLARRDFSINAMAFPLSPPDAELLDPLGGLNDLETRVVRALHDRSFVDDPTRMMRAVRYEQRFGFRIDRDTQDAMTVALAAGHMDAVSGDRWRHELERILDEANPFAPLLRAAGLGLLAGLHPAFGKLFVNDGAGLRRLAESAPTPSASSGQALTLPRREREQLKDECWVALFSPLAAAEGESVIGRLRLSGRRATLGRDTIGLRESEAQIRAVAGRPSQLARMLEGRELAAVSAWAGLTADPVVAEALRHYERQLRFMKPELSGTALVGMGVPQGPMVGAILARLRDARLDGTVKSGEEETALARELLVEIEANSAK